jgi:secondary thiamine-phosphate synthase enzyme
METSTPTSICRHRITHITSRSRTEFVDLTERLQAFVAELGMSAGLINVQSLHTTTAVVVNEHEPLLLTDFALLLEQAAPAAAAYRHDDPRVRAVNVVPGERVNGHAHCRALLLGSSVVLNVIAGKVVLGRWQRVFFVELDGPRDREVSFLALGEGER